MTYNTLMDKAPTYRYERAVTFGRFNIPHQGHLELIQMMLAHGDEAHVYVSTGRSNNDWALRVLLLSHLCRKAHLDLNRVYFMEASSPYEAVSKTLESSPWQEAVIVLGSDQEVMARKLGDVYDCPVILNRRTNSSTQMRFFLDAEDFREDLLHLYDGDEFLTALAMILRREELSHEKSAETARQTAGTTQE